MPKGRNFAPSTQADGIWFPHRGYEEYARQPERTLDTSTGTMLTTTFHPQSSNIPNPPPEPYFKKEYRTFKHKNDFSAHDNRHSFQDHGVYFGDGNESRFLGKRLKRTDQRQHYTGKDFVKHYGRITIASDFNSTYGTSFLGEPTEKPPSYRRFPKLHTNSHPGPVNLSTTSRSWIKQEELPFKTPTQVLASSQEPFLKHNCWKYSYNGISKVYPPFDEIRQKRTQNAVVS
ncbi:testis-expressed protein 36 [Lingula anatina]|uniref:Testis-expressed protein 36 n=1 Tax=Lingula anatina TaxID=7574 RepID=A0A1S3HAQ8_LINAN|nr:testis-expressed protein 36 [Lingula anatina]|eukprot:XP_013383165.1 testis-expressed protein 36 [Lingula anatina]